MSRSQSKLRRILLIDNEKSIRELAQLCLEIGTNCEVLTADSGGEGIVKAETERIDAVLLDLDEKMLDMDWLTILQNLRENPATHHIPVLLLSATAKSTDFANLTKIGAKAVIAKSFDLLNLADRVAAVLDW
jgi:CheY-like chemotaxis protein